LKREPHKSLTKYRLCKLNTDREMSGTKSNESKPARVSMGIPAAEERRIAEEYRLHAEEAAESEEEYPRNDQGIEDTEDTDPLDL